MNQKFPSAFWDDKRKACLELGYLLGYDIHKIADELGCSVEQAVVQATIMKLKPKREFQL